MARQAVRQPGCTTIKFPPLLLEEITAFRDAGAKQQQCIIGTTSRSGMETLSEVGTQTRTSFQLDTVSARLFQLLSYCLMRWHVELPLFGTAMFVDNPFHLETFRPLFSVGWCAGLRWSRVLSGADL